MSSRKDTLFLETTTVPAAKSMAEITAVLVKAGARTINTTYEDGKPAGLEWSMVLYDRPVYFQMPVKVEPVYKTLRSRVSGVVSRDRDLRLREQAERVAWRQLLAWINVQMALIRLGMVEYAQVFLPYVAESPGGRTMWDVARDSHFRMIEGPKQ